MAPDPGGEGGKERGGQAEKSTKEGMQEAETGIQKESTAKKEEVQKCDPETVSAEKNETTEWAEGTEQQRDPEENV